MGPGHRPRSAWQNRLPRTVGVLVMAIWVVLAAAAPARAQPTSHISSGPTPPWVDGIASDVATAAPSDTTEDGLRFLLYDEELRVGDAASALFETYHHWSRQIVNESGLSAASQLRIDFDPTYQSLIVHSLTIRRGDQLLDRLDLGSARVLQRESNLEAQVYDGRQTVVLFLSDLRVGDVIDCSYTLRGGDPTLDGKFADTVALGLLEPIARMRTRVVIPRETRFNVFLDGPKGSPLPGPTETKGDREVTYLWDSRDLPAFHIDPGLPSWYSPIPFASLSSFDSWQEVAEWATRLFRSAPPGPELREWGRVRRHKAASLDQFLLEAVRFVQDEIRYVAIEVGMARRVPGDPNTTFVRRYGDCKEKAALLVAILREGGLHAQPVLVSANWGHVLDRWSPSPLAFDHAIVKVTMADGPVYWVDATELMQGGGLSAFETAPFERALGLDPPGRDLEKMAPPGPSSSVVRVVERYMPSLPGAKSGEARLQMTRTYEGALADTIRLSMRSQTSEQREKYYRAFYEKDFPGIRVAGPIKTDEDRESNFVVVTVPFIIPQFWSGTSTTGFQGDLFARFVDAALLRPEPGRQSPLQVPFPLLIEQRIETIVPFDLRMAPYQDLVDTAAWRLDFAARQDNRTLTYRYTFASKRDVVKVNDLGTQATAVDKARLLLGRTLTYRPPLPDSINWVGLAPFALTLPLLTWAGRRAFRYEPATLADGELGPGVVPARPRIRGWLLLLGVGLALAPLSFVPMAVVDGRFIASTQRWLALTTAGLSTYHPSLASLIAARTVCSLAVIAYTVVINVLFWKKKRRFRFHGKVYLVATFGIHFANTALVQWLGTENVITLNVVTGLIIHLVLSAIWLLYLMDSRRVAETFVRT
jgi:hypothetical protein